MAGGGGAVQGGFAPGRGGVNGCARRQQLPYDLELAVDRRNVQGRALLLSFMRVAVGMLLRAA